MLGGRRSVVGRGKIAKAKLGRREWSEGSKGLEMEKQR